MKLLSTRSQIAILAVMLAAALSFSSVSHAQYGSGGQAPAQQQNPPATQATPPAKAATQQAPPPAADPEQDKAYKAFTDVKAEATDQQIQLGEQYLQKYPTGIYVEQVYARLVGAYYQKQQFDKMYAAADKATAINPDDVTVLTLVGWVIPHQYDPNDPDADRRLAKALAYEKHALDVLPTMPKPPSISDEQFAKAKATATAQAHSGLGLVYFRQQDFANSVSEMQKAIAADNVPDPVDLYIMGVGLSQLKRYPEAVDAFQKCSQMSGPMQDRCKSHAADAKKQAAAAPAPPK
jgi:tetratricopeptide (TPR) repeat protein